MAEAAAHLTDHVFPRLPARQWVLSVPKRLRYYLQRDKGALNAALRIFLRVVRASLHAHCPGAAKIDPDSLHLGAVALRPPLWLQPEHACALEACDAKDMAARASSSSHGGGFSVDAGVRIEAADRAGLERLLRYCARPPFACGPAQAARR